MRAALYLRLRRLHSRELESTKFVDELGVAGEVRIDTAVLNGSFAAYEIKSASDTLRRLPRQVEFYSKVVDYATLVVAENHVTHALDTIPAWWGLIIASTSRSGVKLKRARQARRNHSIEPEWLVRLLWRGEALSALEAHDAARGLRSRPLPILHSELVSAVSTDVLRDLVREALKARSNWRPPKP